MCASLLLPMLTDPKPLPAQRKRREQVCRLVQQEGVEDALRWQVLLPA